MNPNSLNFKLIIGTIHLFAIFILLYFVFSIIDVKDLMSYEFIRLNKDIILKYSLNSGKSFLSNDFTGEV